MKPDLILDLVGLAIALAQAHMQSEDVEQTLIDIVTTAVAAYHDHTGEPLDPQLVGLESRL
jgi:hypothetical protein